MVNKEELPAFVVIALVGILLWVGIAFASSQKDAWDDRSYFGIGIPVMLLTSAIGGFRFPNRPWRWGIAVVFPQPIVSLILRGGIPRFLFVGLLIFAFIAALCVGTAYLGSALRNKLDKDED